MTAAEISENIKNDIFYRIEGLNSLAYMQEESHQVYSSEYLEKGCIENKENEVRNQSLNDALLNAMASLIDYYCIYCMVKIGINVGKITSVQYKPVTKNMILDTSFLTQEEKKERSLELFKKRFDEKIIQACNLNIDEINPHEYWASYLSNSISSILKKYGMSDGKTAIFEFDVGRLRFNVVREVMQYNSCMRFFYANPANVSGVKYEIYVDLNNFLKHNAVPYFVQHKERFDNPIEDRVYSFFRIENKKQIFLKNGFLKDVARIGFDDLKENLELKFLQGNFHICGLEQQWEIGPIIRVDEKNGIASADGNTLYFFIGGIFMARTRDAILVDARASFRSVLADLINDVKLGMGYLDESI